MPKILIFLVCGLIAACPLRAVADQAPPPGVYVYDIRHPVLGSLGRLTNRIDREGARTIVDTELRIVATMLSVVVHRTTADHRQVWDGQRLSLFHSITDDDGDIREVEGHAVGDKFVIHGPAGEVDAPADVMPGNPWSIQFIRATTLMGSDRGTIAPITVREVADETLEIRGAALTARHFVVSGGGGVEVWYSPDDVPVQFSFESHGVPITFHLM